MPLPTVSYEGIPGSGLQLLAPGTADFLSALEQNLTGPERLAIQPLEPFLAVIRNGSGKALAAVMVRHEFRNAAGEVSRSNSLWLTTQNLEHRKVLPGQCLLVGPLGSACRILRGAPAASHARGAPAEAASRAALLAEFDAICVTLDSAVFDDGALLGPDEAGLEQQLREWLRAERELFAEVSGMTADDRSPSLTRIAGEFPLEQPPAPEPAGAYAEHRAETARILLSLLENARCEEQFLQWLDQVIGHTIPDPRRPA